MIGSSVSMRPLGRWQGRARTWEPHSTAPAEPGPGKTRPGQIRGFVPARVPGGQLYRGSSTSRRTGGRATSPRDDLGAAVIGTSFGVMTHAVALRAAGFDVKALVGRDPARTTERAAFAGIPLALTDVDAALALPGVDVVAIATPPQTHSELTMKAIEAGKHVVLEKPFARNFSEAEPMRDAAEKAGIVHIPGNEHRFDPGQSLVGRLVRAGRIGEPRMASYLMQLPTFSDPSTVVPDWWGDASKGGGWVGAQASHVIDNVRGMLGDFAGVSATLPTISQHGWSAEDTFSIHFRTRSGIAGMMQSSIGAMGPVLRVTRVVGTAGTIWMEGQTVYIADKSGEREIEPPPELANEARVRPDDKLLRSTYDRLCASANTVPPYTRLYETFRSRIQGVEPKSPVAPATFADGLAVQKVIDAVRQADRAGTWVEIE